MGIEDVFEWLPAPGHYAQDEHNLRLFGQFIGSWDIKGTWYRPDGSRRTGRGECAAGAPPHQFGSTLRCYDSSIDAWHLSWMQPASGEFVKLTGRQVGDRIVCESVDPDPPRRWSFNDITRDSFTWLGEVSNDQGKTWFLEQETRGARCRGGSAKAS